MESEICGIILAQARKGSVGLYGSHFNESELRSQLSGVDVGRVDNGTPCTDTPCTCDVLLTGPVLSGTDNVQQSVMADLLTQMHKQTRLLIVQDLSKSSWSMASLTQSFEQFCIEQKNERLSLLMCSVQQMDTAVKTGNNLHFCWNLSLNVQPVTKDNVKKHVSERDFLDQTQYQEKGIKAYERIFGAGFISPGGAEQNLYFLNMLKPQPGSYMLDVGVGIGGSALQVAKEFDCRVLGMDLSSNTLTIALNRLQATPDLRVRYLLADVMSYDFADSTFDIVYSRDVIQHIGDKRTLYDRLCRCLKPGGRLLTTGYTAGQGKQTDKFQAYLKARQYGLKPSTEYVQACRLAGFSSVECVDLTPRFREILQSEIKNAETNEQVLTKEFGAAKYRELLDGWRSKITYIDDQMHCWTMMLCTK